MNSRRIATRALLATVFFSLNTVAGVNEVRISDVLNTIIWDGYNVYLEGGSTHTIEITFDATNGAGYTWTGHNAFELYSPDGADWGYLQATRGQYILDLPLKYTPPDCFALESFLKHANKEGNSGTWVFTPTVGQIQQCFMPEPTLIDDPYTNLPAGGNVNGNDTVGFYHAAVGIGVGFPGGTAGVALKVEFRTDLADMGRHICFDSVAQFGITTPAWEWFASGSGLQDLPTWNNGQGSDGPICWEIWMSCNFPPAWCNEINSANLQAGYCTEISYPLCATACSHPADISYSMVPPYDNGDFGTIDSETGLWTWSGSTVQPGAYSIPFRAFESGLPSSEDFTLNVLVTSDGCDCCSGTVGDANDSGDPLPTIGDINALIDHLFVSEQPLACYPEADANNSGGPYPHPEDITIGDINMLIDYLFVTGPDNMELPVCPEM